MNPVLDSTVHNVEQSSRETKKALEGERIDRKEGLPQF